MGGYVKYYCCFFYFVYKIFDGVKFEDVVLFFCGGIFMYLFLKCFGCGLGRIVGIIGVGGFGYFGIVIVKVLGVDCVVGIFCWEVK